MRKTVCIILLMFLIQTLFGCSRETDKNSNPENAKTTLNYGIIEPNPEKRELYYNGNEVKFKFSMENGDVHASWGIRIYLNGILQPYKIEDSISSDYLILDTDKNDIFEINISFMPNNIKTEGDNIVHILVFINPEHLLTDLDYISYDNNHRIGQLLPWKLVVGKDCPSKAPPVSSRNFTSDVMTKSVKEKYDDMDENGNEFSYLDKTNLFFLNNDEVITAQKGQVNLNIESYGIKSKYRLAVYVNHNIISAFGGKEYLDIDIQSGMTSKCTQTVEINLLEQYNHIYVIAVPLADELSDALVDVVKSDSQILYNEG